MPSFCKIKPLQALLGAAAIVLTGSAAQAMHKESTASRLFRETVNTVIAGPSVVIDKAFNSVVHGSTSWHRQKFFELVEACGYELGKAETIAGLIPEIKLVYEQSRELSQSDREALEEEIAEFEEEDPTWIEGKLEAKILRVLLSASEMGQYRISEFEIQVLPLPGLLFQTKPVYLTYTPDTNLIMRRMNELQDLMRGLPNPNSSTNR